MGADQDPGSGMKMVTVTDMEPYMGTDQGMKTGMVTDMDHGTVTDMDSDMVLKTGPGKNRLATMDCVASPSHP
jgi:hypothetical protein